MKQSSIFLDLFSGVGGFPLGFEMAGYKFKKHYFSEIDKHCIANYKYNFKNAEYVGDVKNISGITERPNIITFGFPCQDISIAGKGRGFNGERSSLFFEAIRLIKEYKPDIFIFENVKGLLSHNKGETFEIVLQTIADIGLYECEWQLLNTVWLLPQNRERIYFIGHLRGRSKPRIFPFTEANFRINERQSETSIVRTITAGGHSGGHHSGMTLIKEVNPDISYAISATYAKGKYGKSRGTLIQPKIINKPRGFNAGSESEICGTITKNSFEHNNHVNRIRRLTEIECEKLQGFPINWTKYGIYNDKILEIAKTNRYKMMGNAVTTLIVKMIAERLLNEIK